MIHRAMTIKKDGYDPDTLPPGSSKFVIALCPQCNRFLRVMMKNEKPDSLCRSCANSSTVAKAWKPEKSTYKPQPCCMCGKPHTHRTEGGHLLCSTHEAMYYSLKNSITSRDGVRCEY